MIKITAKLRIGEKVGLGFALIGLLFLAVVWQYHKTYSQSLANYQRLHQVDEVKKSHAQKIANRIFEARVAEKEFLLQREEKFVSEVGDHIKAGKHLITELAKIDPSIAENANRMADDVHVYYEHFLSVVEAWRIKGLDHDSGLQGAFRDTVHELESIANRFNSGPLYLQLLRILRAENDPDLAPEQLYPLIEAFTKQLTGSSLPEDIKSELLAETKAYRQGLEAVSGPSPMQANAVGREGYRTQATRIEEMITRYYVPDFDASILQLRRREKDYLLRHDKVYVDMALAEITQVQEEIDSSLISDENKSHIKLLMDRYQRDFLALVAQNDRIDRLIEQMNEAVERINRLAQLNVEAADQAMALSFEEVNSAAMENERLMYQSVVLATLLAIGFVVFLTRSIARPLRKMIGLLDQMVYEEPSERMPVDPKGRDEVNAMAISLNAMADHKQRFVDWWKSSMAEADACNRFKEAMTSHSGEFASSGLEAVSDDLKAAILSKKDLFTNQCEGMEQLTGTILDRTDELLKSKPSGDALMAIDSIRHSAKAINNFLEIITNQETRG